MKTITSVIISTLVLALVAISAYLVATGIYDHLNNCQVSSSSETMNVKVCDSGATYISK